MAFNGSGTWVRLYNWQNDSANGVKIRADRLDNETNDMTANGLSLCLTRDGQGQPSADLPMNSHKHTGVTNGTARTHYASIGQLQDNGILFAAAAGTADAITAALTPTTASLVDGEQHCIRALLANATTTPTYAPDGLTAHTITKAGGAALAAGDIAGPGHELILRYNLANTRWELLNPSVGDYISGTVVEGSAIALTNTTAANITSISLPPGDWDVTGNVLFIGNVATTVTRLLMGVTTASATLPATAGTRADHTFSASPALFNIDSYDSNWVGPTRLSVSVTTTVYLVAFAQFGTSTCSAFGRLSARRSK